MRRFVMRTCAGLIVLILWSAHLLSTADAQNNPYLAYGTGLAAGDRVDVYVADKHCVTALADSDGNWGPVVIPEAATCAPKVGALITFLLNGLPTNETDVYAFGGAPANVVTGFVLTLDPFPNPEITGALPASGVALVSWSGGTVAQLLSVAAADGCHLDSLWVSKSGSLVGYVVGAPGFVNTGFLNLYPEGGLPAAIPLLVVCTPAPELPIPDAGCVISGRLTDTDSGAPIGGVIVGLVEYAEDARDDTPVNPNAGSTDVDGRFAVSCDGIAMSRFPLRITLTRSDWWAIWHTNVVVEVGGRQGIQITTSLCQELRPLDSPLATDTLLDGGPTRLLTLNPNGNSVAYDFNPRIVSASAAEGDFYFSSCGEPTFWANNNGPPYWQQGVVDLGDVGVVSLEDVVPPSTGYFNFGVPAVVGHTYVSKARQEFAGDYIVFRLVGIEAEGVVITEYVLEYYYRAGN